jgi:hypothetical protein
MSDLNLNRPTLYSQNICPSVFGMVDASGKTLTKQLSKGSACLYIGGIAELYLASPTEERLYLKKRKGFIKLALRAGAEIIPIYYFGNSIAFKVCICVSMYLCIHVSMNPCIYVSMCLCIYVSMYLCIYASMHLCIQVSMYPCIYVSMYLCIYVFMYPCIYVSEYLSIYVSMCLSFSPIRGILITNKSYLFSNIYHA